MGPQVLGPLLEPKSRPPDLDLKATSRPIGNVFEVTHGFLAGTVLSLAKAVDEVDDDDDDDDDGDDDDADDDYDDEDGDGGDDLTIHSCMCVHVFVHAAQ